MRIGLLGAGRHGQRYARHLAIGDVPGAKLTALWRRDATLGRAVAEERGARYEAKLEAVVHAPDVDLVVAAVPVGVHLPVALAVAAAKKPLLLEKPMALGTADARRMIEAFSAVGQPLMIAQTLRFDPLTTMLKRRAAELGGLRGFRFEQRLEPRGLAWEDDPAASGGGVLMQTGIHVLDALRFTTGARDVRVHHARTARMQYAHNEDHAVIIAELHDPSLRGGADRPAILGDVGVSKIGTSRHMRYTLFLEEVGLEADYVARTFTETRIRDRVVTEVPEEPTIPPALKAFIAAVEGRAPNPIPGEDAMASLALVEAAYARARG